MRCVKLALLLLLGLGFLSLSPRAGLAADGKIPCLLVTGHDVDAHPWRLTTPVVRKQLEDSGKFDVKVCEDTSILESSKLDAYKVIVLNFGFWDVPQLSDRAKENLLNYVKNGGGLMPLHFSCSSYQDWKGIPPLCLEALVDRETEFPLALAKQEFGIENPQKAALLKH